MDSQNIRFRNVTFDTTSTWGVDVAVSLVTSNTILEAVIRDRWDNNYEQKLINEYNGAQLGIYGASTTDEYKAVVQSYTDFLTERNTLKETVDADCAELGIL